MALAAVFLATVTKVPAAVRLELVAVNLVATCAAVLSRIAMADVIEHYSVALARLASLALVGYATVPGFDSSFARVVRLSATLLAQYAHSLRALIRF